MSTRDYLVKVKQSCKTDDQLTCFYGWLSDLQKKNIISPATLLYAAKPQKNDSQKET